MRRFSPYNYAYNNPIRYIDADGRKPDDWIKISIGGATYFYYDKNLKSEKAFNDTGLSKQGYSYVGKEANLTVTNYVVNTIAEIPVGEKEKVVTSNVSLHEDGSFQVTTKTELAGDTPRTTEKIDVNGKSDGYTVSTSTADSDGDSTTQSLTFVDNTNNNGTMKDQTDIKPDFNRCPKPGCGGAAPDNVGPQGVSKGKSGNGEDAPGQNSYEIGTRINHWLWH